MDYWGGGGARSSYSYAAIAGSTLIGFRSKVLICHKNYVLRFKEKLLRY